MRNKSAHYIGVLVHIRCIIRTSCLYHQANIVVLSQRLELLEQKNTLLSYSARMQMIFKLLECYGMSRSKEKAISNIHVFITNF